MVREQYSWFVICGKLRTHGCKYNLNPRSREVESLKRSHFPVKFAVAGYYSSSSINRWEIISPQTNVDTETDMGYCTLELMQTVLLIVAVSLLRDQRKEPWRTYRSPYNPQHTQDVATLFTMDQLCLSPGKAKVSPMKDMNETGVTELIMTSLRYVQVMHLVQLPLPQEMHIQAYLHLFLTHLQRLLPCSVAYGAKISC